MLDESKLCIYLLKENIDFETMKQLIQRIKQWAIELRYFFSVGSVLWIIISIISVVRNDSTGIKAGFFLTTLLFCLITYWLVRGGHYGDMDCE